MPEHTVNMVTLEMKKFMDEHRDNLEVIDRLIIENIFLLFEHSFIMASLLLEMNDRVKRLEDELKDFYLQKAAERNG